MDWCPLILEKKPLESLLNYSLESWVNFVYSYNYTVVDY